MYFNKFYNHVVFMYVFGGYVNMRTFIYAVIIYIVYSQACLTHSLDVRS